MERPIYVIGHTHPDTDAICSALAYADLKKTLGLREVIACRAGNIKAGTRWVLEQFGCSEPLLLEDVRTRVADMVDPQVVSVTPATTLREIGYLIKHQKVKTIPVVDDQNHLLGLVTVGDIAQKYMDELADEGSPDIEERVKRIRRTKVNEIMRKDALIFFEGSELAEDARKVMLETRYRNYPVVDDQHHLLGVVSRYHLLALSRKKVILVDHNERGQAVNGIEEAQILEIIDHHRLGDLQTGEPIYIRNEPVGSTSTIVAGMYWENELEPTQAVAGILCAGIIADTLLFKSPTCTLRDRQTAYRLAALAGVQVEQFGREMFKASSSLIGLTPQEIFYQDFKEFRIGDQLVGISQIETIDMERVEKIKPDLLEVMEEARRNRNYDLVLLMLTDVLQEGSELLVVGSNPARVAQALGGTMSDERLYLPGVISRKKQIVPPLVKFFTR